MRPDRHEAVGRQPERSGRVRELPRPATAALTASVSLVVICMSWWLATRPGVGAAQSGPVTWLNDPPQPLAAVLAATNPLFRPWPLTVVALGLLGWVLLTATPAVRREMVRGLVVSVVLAEAVAQTIKRVAHTVRPTASVAGLDVHGYPKDPYGHSYPSAHTGVAVAVVAALWPWMTRPQRLVGLAFAALVALNRIYIGAHWPLDVLGGTAVGLLSGSICWLVAARWPIRAVPR